MIYFLQEGSAGPIKIGTSRTVAKRKSALQGANSAELVLRLLLDGGRPEEQVLHRQFAADRINPRREWFRPSVSLLRFISEQKGALGLPPASPQTQRGRQQIRGHRIRLWQDEVEEVIRWCAESIRPVTVENVRATLNNPFTEVPSRLRHALTQYRHRLHTQRLKDIERILRDPTG